MSLLSKELGIKKNELRQRFISLISAGKLPGKLDPDKDEYIFPRDRIEEATLERPPVSLHSESPVAIRGALKDSIVDIFKSWYPVIGSMGSVAGAAVTIYSLTQNIIIPILLPVIVFPTIFIYIFYTHYWKKKGEK